MAGADGTRSTIRPAVLERDYPCIPSGFSCYRFLFPGKRCGGTPLEYLIDKENPTFALMLGPDRRIAAYACRNMELVNVVATLPDKALHEEVHDTWIAEGSLENMRRNYDGFHPEVKLIMEYIPPSSLTNLKRFADECKLWQLRDHDVPVKKWVKGKTIIIGDAAHSMLPRMSS